MNFKIFTFLCFFIAISTSAPNNKIINQLKSNTNDQMLKIAEVVNEGKNADFSLECTICLDAMKAFDVLIGGKLTPKCVKALIDYLCDKLQVEDNYICNAISSEYQTEILYVLNQLIKKPQDICGLMLSNCGTPLDSNWLIPIPGGKPPVQPWKLPKWDYMIWTGDLPPHNVWNQSKADQLAVLSQLTTWLQKYMPKRKIFLAVGNHESSPVDNFPPHTVPAQYSISWLYDKLAEDWTLWVPKSLTASIQWRASYVTEVYPGLRIISLNTQYCDALSFWLYLNQTDPDGTLVWLTAQLLDAEAAGVKVHIMGHIPPGVDYCLKQWSYNFYRVVHRFESTISALFYGHTHTDSFSVFYEEESGKRGRPFHVMYVAPSVTTFSFHQPTYRIYTIDGNYPGSSFQVLDHETHMMNLLMTNAIDFPSWKFEYSAKATYGLQSLFPSDWSNLIETFISNNALFEKYAQYYSRHAAHCDAACKYEKLCEMRSAHSFDSITLCNDLPQGKTSKRALTAAKLISNTEIGLQKLLGNIRDVHSLKGGTGDVISACLPIQPMKKKAGNLNLKVITGNNSRRNEFSLCFFIMLFGVLLVFV